jgi:hypothetical protein
VSALVRAAPSSLIAVDDSLAAHVTRFLRWFRFVRERAQHTVDAYASDLRMFLEFAALGGLVRPGRAVHGVAEADTTADAVARRQPFGSDGE